MLSLSSSSSSCSLHIGQRHNLLLHQNVPTKTHFQRRSSICRELITTRSSIKLSGSCNSQSTEERYSLSGLVPFEAILFDVDGTLCDSDPLHYYAFRELLQELGYNKGIPITEEFFIEKIAGKHNVELSRLLFPDWDLEKGLKFMDDKEAMFRRLAAEKLEPVNGLKRLCKWIDDCGLKRGAVTNAPRSNAELLVSVLGLSNFFQTVVVANDCERAKPFPDPYLKGLEGLKACPNHTLVFEDSVPGITAAVAAGMRVVGIVIRNPEHLLLEAGATFLIKDYNDPKLWAELEALQTEATETTVGS